MSAQSSEDTGSDDGGGRGVESETAPVPSGTGSPGGSGLFGSSGPRHAPPGELPRTSGPFQSGMGSPHGPYAEPGAGGMHGTAGRSPTRQERLAGLTQAAQDRAAAGSAQRSSDGKQAPRRAHLQVARLEPWSVMKFSFVMSLVSLVVLLVAVGVLYMILSVVGVFDAISSTVSDLTREQNSGEGGLDVATWFSFTRVFGITALIGAVNVLFITALSTVGAVIYNMASDLVGGVEIMLKEAE